MLSNLREPFWRLRFNHVTAKQVVCPCGHAGSNNDWVISEVLCSVLSCNLVLDTHIHAHMQTDTHWFSSYRGAGRAAWSGRNASPLGRIAAWSGSACAVSCGSASSAQPGSRPSGQPAAGFCREGGFPRRPGAKICAASVPPAWYTQGGG